MKKQIENGFVIIETIVVIVFVLGMITFLFNNVLPLVGEYERIDKYDHIGSKYDAHLIRKMLLKDDDCKLENILSFGSEPYNRFAGKDICLYLNNKNYCDKLLSKDFLDVKEIIITSYNTITFKEAAKDKFSRETKDYIDYIPKFNNTYIPEQYTFKKRLIIVFNDGTISNIELLKALNGSCTGGMACQGASPDALIALARLNDIESTLTGVQTQLTKKINKLDTHPIGSIYISTNSANPSTLFGGTWVAWGTGRVPVGIDTGQTEFNTVEKTGGAISNNYSQNATTLLFADNQVWGKAGAHTKEFQTGSSADYISLKNVTGMSWGGSSGQGVTLTSTHRIYTPIDLSTVNTMQPYITSYMWKRTN